MAGFRTSARAVDMLGRQQIAGIPSAISELFKNAHDAYATNAIADFIRYKDIFVIRDDGYGMSRVEFEQRWLTLGTSSKSVAGQSITPRGRNQRAILGEKGIGRLAIAAIGPQTLVLTKKQGENKTTAGLIHWGVFELAHADLSDLIIPVTELHPGQLPNMRDLGRQVLENLRELVTVDDPGLLPRVQADLDRWSKVDLQQTGSLVGQNFADLDSGTCFIILPTSPDLEADLEPSGPKEAAPLLRTLIGFANTMTPGHSSPELSTVFRVHRTVDDVRDLIQEQEFFTVEEFLKADHHFQGVFDDFGHFYGTVSIFGGEPIEFPISWRQARGVPTKCGPFNLSLAYVQGRAKQSNMDANDYYVMIEKLDRYGGLYIYRDGIRVLPYGDSRFDWLDVELRRTKSASDSFFSYRRMFGAVEITRESNSQLREKAGREGFSTNEAYRQFRAILQNFLLQVANEFFREGGPQAELYEEGRLANERMENARRARNKQVRARRSAYGAELEKFFQAIDSEMPAARVSSIKRELQAAVELAEREPSPATAAERLVRAELEARSQIRELSSRLQVTRPRGVALSADLSRQSAAYEAARADLISSIVAPAEDEIDRTIRKAGSEVDAAIHRRLRLDESIDLAITESRDVLNRIRHDLTNQIDQMVAKFATFNRESHRALESDFTEVQRISANTNVAGMTDEAFTALRSVLENRVRKSAEEHLNEFQSLLEQLRSVVWPDEARSRSEASLMDQVEQLEARVESLTDRAAQDFELVQVGMAVNIVTHEFQNSIRSVRDNLRRLRSWAKGNPDLRPLYADLRASFDHLDGYLRLFTPLHRRLYREPTTIRGVDIVRYIRDVFDAKMSESEVTLDVSAEFTDMRIKMYPSTLYPVIVNLVDNALYWLSSHSGRRVISLDFSGASISVTDSGPGVSPGDEDAVFEQGFSRKPAGSGYGLFVAREVLRRDGADIRIAPARADRGARFEIILPPE